MVENVKKQPEEISGNNNAADGAHAFHTPLIHRTVAQINPAPRAGVMHR